MSHTALGQEAAVDSTPQLHRKNSKKTKKPSFATMGSTLSALSGYHYHCFGAWVDFPRAIETSRGQNFTTGELMISTFVYNKNEMVLELEKAGFKDIQVQNIPNGPTYSERLIICKNDFIHGPVIT